MSKRAVTLRIVEEYGKPRYWDMVLSYYDFDYVLKHAGYTKDTKPTDNEFFDALCNGNKSVYAKKVKRYTKAMERAEHRLFSKLTYDRVGEDDDDIGIYLVWEKENVK